MKKLRITKYNPALRNSHGHYMADDWTAVSDIGNCYGGAVLTPAAYQAVENNYVDAILCILSQHGVQSLQVTLLEQGFCIEELRDMLGQKGITISEAEGER